jgi:hypothetical protein
MEQVTSSATGAVHALAAECRTVTGGATIVTELKFCPDVDLEALDASLESQTDRGPACRHADRSRSDPPRVVAAWRSIAYLQNEADTITEYMVSMLPQE